MADKADVNTPSSSYRFMLPKWQAIMALLGGTDTMRAADRAFLPQHENEDDQSYRNRLAGTFLLNYFGKTASTLASKPFTKEAKLGDKMPEELAAMEDDIDRQGSDLTAFCKEVFEDALAKGFTGIYVDMPEANPGQVQTLDDEQKLNIHPYFCHVPAESIIAAYTEVENGVEKLTHVRISESVVERNGWEERTVSRIRVYEPGHWQLWENDGSKWVKIKEGVTKLDYIPMVIYYTGKKLGTCKALPPLQDLADKNIEHWQSSSDQRNVLTVARFPILAVSGLADIESVTIGPRIVLATDDAQGKYYYVEHDGKAIEAGAKDLDTIERHMAMLGLELLVRRTGNTTATETAVNTAQSHCALEEMIENFSDAIELCFSYAADWLGIKAEDDAISVEFDTDFGLEEGDISGLAVLEFARTNKDISRETFLAELKRRKHLSAEFDAEADKELLDSEPPPLALMRLPPGAPPGTLPGGAPPKQVPPATKLPQK